MKRMTVLPLKFSIAIIPALALLLWPASEARAFCEEAAITCTQVEEPSLCHREITEQALSFVRPELVSRIVGGNLHNDHEHTAGRWEHSDSCDFGVTEFNINFILANPEDHGAIDDDCFVLDSPHCDSRSVVGLLDPLRPNPFDAAFIFGYATHPIQDFYSHSNWFEWFDRSGVPEADIPIMEPTVDLWDARVNQAAIVPQAVLGSLGVGGVMLVSQGFAFPHTIIRDSGLFPLVTDGDTLFAAIFSDTNPIYNDNCPHGIGMRHPEINKDDHCSPNNEFHPDHRSDHFKAARLAIRQTAHEWCRLLNLQREQWGLSGVSTAMGLWVDPDAPRSGPGSPHPPGTPCEATAPGDSEVTVDAQIGLQNDSVRAFRHHANLVLYTTDLTRSDRREVTVDIDGLAREVLAPGPISLCLTAEQAGAAVATVQGWRDQVGDPNGIDAEDHVFLGVHAELGNLGPGQHHLVTDDLDVLLEVSNMPTDADADGLFRCRELELGLDPADPDSDDDGLDDGAEIDGGTDPLDPDSDDDGVLDGSDAFPKSDPRPTVVIAACDSGVANDHVFPNGANFNDLLGTCIGSAKNPGAFVSCVTSLVNEWRQAGLITAAEKTQIMECAAPSPILRGGKNNAATRVERGANVGPKTTKPRASKTAPRSR